MCRDSLHARGILREKYFISYLNKITKRILQTLYNTSDKNEICINLVDLFLSSFNFFPLFSCLVSIYFSLCSSPLFKGDFTAYWIKISTENCYLINWWKVKNRWPPSFFRRLRFHLHVEEFIKKVTRLCQQWLLGFLTNRSKWWLKERQLHDVSACWADMYGLFDKQTLLTKSEGALKSSGVNFRSTTTWVILHLFYNEM